MLAMSSNILFRSQKKEEENNLENELEMVVLGLKKPSSEGKRKSCMIYPNDSFKIWWDVFVSIILLISCFSTPLDLAFPQVAENDADYRRFNYTIDCLFLVDIIISFLSAI